jgi:sugar lactone lactonase YvrE
MLSAEPLTPRVGGHCESPFWDARTERILWLDVFAPAVLALDLSDQLVSYSLPVEMATVLRRRTSGGFVIATGHRLVAADDALAAFEPLTDLTDDPDLRTNDGGCDPLGAFIIGTMAHDETPSRGSVYRVAPDHHVEIVLRDVSISNGVQWSADGSRVYYIDTPTKRVDVFDFNSDSGEWSGRRIHIDLVETSGSPDGMAIDENDGLWIALWGAGRVNHYDSDGRFVESIRVPGVSQTSACTFGGVGQNVLYITTSRQGIADADEPRAGSLFAVETTSRGAVIAEFAG